LFASGSMKHAPEIARLLGQELNDQGPKPIPLRSAFGNFLRGSGDVKPTVYRKRLANHRRRRKGNTVMLR
jgi:hypothetical protein